MCLLLCYAIIEAHIDMPSKIEIHIYKSIKSLSTNWGSGYKIAWIIDKLSQHAITQSQTGETRHAIPICYAQTSYPSMQSANQKPAKPEMLSWHAVA